MDQKQLQSQGNTGVQINIPNNLPVLYTDSVYVTASKHGIVFDFAQNVISTNSQNVVSRMGMSKEHARALYKILGQKISEVDRNEGRNNHN